MARLWTSENMEAITRALGTAMALLFLAGTAMGQAIPPGKYQLTCQDTVVTGQALESNCKTPSGQLRATRLEDYRSCVDEIVNKAGTLSCTKGSPAPLGSYTQTCRGSYVAGNTLFSTCQTQSGMLRTTQLPDISQCLGDITNGDGQLQCNKGGTPPRGSYTKTCRDSFVTGVTLHGSCKTATGMWQTSQLDDFQRCRGDIINDNGKLRCAPGASGAAQSEVPTIEGCRNVEMSGNVLSASCKTDAGRWQPTLLSDPDSCRGPIRNSDGKLVCGRDKNFAPRKP